MTENEFKQRLTEIANALMRCEVRGQTTLIVADVIRELDNLIQAPISEENNVTD